MIVTRPDIGFLRTDDDFILRFLRARKFDQVETFRLLAQYFQFRQQNLGIFQSFKVCFNLSFYMAVRTRSRGRSIQHYIQELYSPKSPGKLPAEHAE